MKKPYRVMGWAIVDDDGNLGKSHLSPQITAYQIFDSDCVDTPYIKYRMVPVEILIRKRGRRS